MDSGSERRSRSPERRDDRKDSDRDRGNNTRTSKSDLRVFFSNFPYTMNWREIKDYFRRELDDPECYVKLYGYDDPLSKSKGCGTIEFRKVCLICLFGSLLLLGKRGLPSAYLNLPSFLPCLT